MLRSGSSRCFEAPSYKGYKGKVVDATETTVRMAGGSLRTSSRPTLNPLRRRRPSTRVVRAFTLVVMV